MLGKTFGVPLFQEQAMKIAIVRRRLHAGRGQWAPPRDGDLPQCRDHPPLWIEDGRGDGERAATAATSRQRCYNQIKGFGSYGFPESHAQSFAQAGLCLGLAEMPLSGGIHLRAAELPADGLLRAGPDRSAMRASMASRCAARHQHQRL